MRQETVRIGMSVAAMALLGGCAAPPPFHMTSSPKPCNGSCDVAVSVSTTWGVCFASITPDDSELEVSRGRQAKITWRIGSTDGLNYQFKAADDPTQGIAFKPRTPITAADFDSANREGQDKFSWRSVNGRPDKQTFEYSINLQRLPKPGHSGNAVDCWPLDPKITNDGS